MYTYVLFVYMSIVFKRLYKYNIVFIISLSISLYFVSHFLYIFTNIYIYLLMHY